jgi:hypothetical protein
LIEQSAAFASTVIDLHQAEELPADSYVLDLDTMATNCELICSEAHRLGLEVIAMTELFGRHPAALEPLDQHPWADRDLLDVAARIEAEMETRS